MTQTLFAGVFLLVTAMAATGAVVAGAELTPSAAEQRGLKHRNRR